MKEDRERECCIGWGPGLQANCILRCTQKAYDQNKKATINKIINGNFSLDNMEQEFPNIEDVEDVYVPRLEEGNARDTTQVEFPDTQHSKKYGRFTEQEVRG